MIPHRLMVYSCPGLFPESKIKHPELFNLYSTKKTQQTNPHTAISPSNQKHKWETLICVLYLEVPASTFPLVAHLQHLQCATQSTPFFGTKTYHHIFQNVLLSSKWSKFVPGMEHAVSDRESNRMVNNLAILLTIWVIYFIYYATVFMTVYFQQHPNRKNSTIKWQKKNRYFLEMWSEDFDFMVGLLLSEGILIILQVT